MELIGKSNGEVAIVLRDQVIALTSAEMQDIQNRWDLAYGKGSGGPWVLWNDRIFDAVTAASPGFAPTGELAVSGVLNFTPPAATA